MQNPRTLALAARNLNRLTLRGGDDQSPVTDSRDRIRQRKKRKRKLKETAFSILMSEEKKRRPWKQNPERTDHASNPKTDKEPEEYAHGHLRSVARVNKNEISKPPVGIISWDEWEQRQRDAMRAHKRKQALPLENRAEASRRKAEHAKSNVSEPSSRRTYDEVTKTIPIAPTTNFSKSTRSKEQLADGKVSKELRLTPAMLESMTKRQLLKAAARSGICACRPSQSSFQ